MMGGREAAGGMMRPACLGSLRPAASLPPTAGGRGARPPALHGAMCAAGPSAGLPAHGAMSGPGCAMSPCGMAPGAMGSMGSAAAACFGAAGGAPGYVAGPLTLTLTLTLILTLTLT